MLKAAARATIGGLETFHLHCCMLFSVLKRKTSFSRLLIKILQFLMCSGPYKIRYGSDWKKERCSMLYWTDRSKLLLLWRIKIKNLLLEIYLSIVIFIVILVFFFFIVFFIRLFLISIQKPKFWIFIVIVIWFRKFQTNCKI